MDLAAPGQEDALRRRGAELVNARAAVGSARLRLYRGLTRRFDPSGVDPGVLSGTDFTDCPCIALRYAAGRTGVVLIVDVPERGLRVTEELWLGASASRFMVWGAFDAFVVAEIPAKMLRAELRRAGVGALPEQDKSQLLRRHIALSMAHHAAASGRADQ